MQTLSMAAQSSNPANATVGLSHKLDKMIASGSQDYNSWRLLILEIETEPLEDINTISLAYDTLLSKFPLCHWHLEKYANHKAKLGSPQEAVNIYERGLGTAMYAVGFWVDYFAFGAACFGDPEDVRRLFRRAISFVDKDYYCHALWDKYMKYEFNLEGWNFLAHSYIQALRFPTKKLRFYYDNFKQFVANLKEEIGSENSNSIVEQVPVSCPGKKNSSDEISLIIKELLDSSDSSIKSKALDRYSSIGEEFYQGAHQMDEKIKCFEKKIQRRYFCATPLDDDQLDNWHLYLDFIEKQDDADWAMKLYERCLIPCACYPEFWMRYVEFLNSKGGLELSISALDRATQIFLKNVPEIHLFNAIFREHIGDIDGARAALSLCDVKTDSAFIRSVVTLANLEKRRGNFAAASVTYEKALKSAKEKQKAHLQPSLYFHFAHLTLLTTGSAVAARDILIRGVQDVPRCRFLLEELIKFAMTHEGGSHVNVIDPIIGDAISNEADECGGLRAKDREDISNLYLEFVDLCGSAHDIRKAWNRHTRSFPVFLRMKKTPYKNCANTDYAPIETKHEQEQIRPSSIQKQQKVGSVHDEPETDRAGPTRTTAPWSTASDQIASCYSGEQSCQLQMFYQYQQQQLLQQQYQQQMQMQSDAYSQMQYNYYNQQPNQMQPNQQQYGQNNEQNQQLQQGQGQYHQLHDAAYQAYQLAYQQQGQQMLLQQYQQNSTQNMSHNEQGSRKARAEYDAPAESSESPLPRAQSPQELQ